MIDPVTLAALGAALDAASLRQQAGAANIANINTAGYSPTRVKFEELMLGRRRAGAQRKNCPAGPGRAAPGGREPDTERSLRRQWRGHRPGSRGPGAQRLALPGAGQDAERPVRPGRVGPDRREALSMDYQSAFAISAAGMSAEKLRADVAALNLANANTPLSAKGAGFQPLRVMSSARATAAVRGFGAMVEQGLSVDQALSVAPYRAPARRVYEPGIPRRTRTAMCPIRAWIR